MAKKVTVAELVIKLGMDTKEAVRGIKNTEKLLKDSTQKQKRIASDKVKQDNKQARFDENRLKHQERMQLQSHRAKLQREKVLLQEKLRSGQRVRRAEEAAHRKAVREHQQRERASRKSSNTNVKRTSVNGGGTSIGNIAIGSALGVGLTAAITGAIQAGFALFDTAKTNTIERERVVTQTYGKYRARGMTPERARLETSKDVDIISDLNKRFGYSFSTTGGAYQAATSSGADRTQVQSIISTILQELKASGATEDAAQSFVREIKPLLSGGDIDATSARTIEDRGLLPVLASMLGETEKSLSSIAKSGKLNEVTGKLTLTKILSNLERFGTGKYIQEDKSMNPVTLAQQELDMSLNRLKDVFAIHSSTGIAASLNTLAEALSDKSTQDMIIKAGENFGKLLISASEGVNNFVNAGGLNKLSDVLSSENLSELSKNIDSLLRLVAAFSDVVGAFVTLGDNIGRMAAELFGGYRDPKQLELADKVGKGESTNTVTDPFKGSTGYMDLKRSIDNATSLTPSHIVKSQLAPVVGTSGGVSSNSSSSTQIDQSKTIHVNGNVTSDFLRGLEKDSYEVGLFSSSQ